MKELVKRSPVQQRIVVVLAGALLDAVVVKDFGIESGTRYQICLEGSTEVVEYDMNRFNCVEQKCKSVNEYETLVEEYCQKLAEDNSTVEDGITGSILEVSSQVSNLIIDASETAAADTNVVGLKGYEAVTSIAELVPTLLQHADHRAQGCIPSHKVLVRAKAGSGKTWSMIQLTHLLAKLMNTQSEPHDDHAVNFVPVIISIQKLSRKCKDVDIDLNSILRYILDSTKEKFHSMLRMAFELRAIIIILDGLDEAAGRSKAIEHLIFEDLVPMGFRCVITSRPEGISNLERFASSGFIIMNLEPLTEDQQLEAINGQLKGDGRVTAGHLFAFKMIREKLDKMYKDKFPKDEREMIEEF